MCNHNCNFCYLYNNHNKNVLDLDILSEKLQIISKNFNIEKFNLYGGEITLLETDYLKKLNEIIIKYGCKNYVTSNFYNIEKLKLFDNAIISTSLNKERPDYNYIRKILKNGINLQDITVLSMVTPSIINKSIDEVLSSYNNLNIGWLSFIKYYPSINTGDVFNISQEKYEDFLIKALEYYTNNRKMFDYRLCLESGLKLCIKKRYPIATNDQCIRISPEGKFGAIYYDEKNLEYFKWYDNIDDYISDCNKEKLDYIKKCGTCRYYGNCWTEHLTNLKCDGCKNLLRTMERIDNE